MTNSLNVRRRFVVTTLSVLLLCLIAPLTAQAKDNWTSVRSKTFLLVGNASEKEMRQVATRPEQFRDVFTRLFSGARFTSPVPTTVIVFKSMNSYKPFNPGNNAGYFQKGHASRVCLRNLNAITKASPILPFRLPTEHTSYGQLL